MTKQQVKNFVISITADVEILQTGLLTARESKLNLVDKLDNEHIKRIKHLYGMLQLVTSIIGEDILTTEVEDLTKL